MPPAATFFARIPGPSVSFLLPILVITLPVLAIAVLATKGMRLSGSCGGMNPDGSCQRCGKPVSDSDSEGACQR